MHSSHVNHRILDKFLRYMANYWLNYVSLILAPKPVSDIAKGESTTLAYEDQILGEPITLSDANVAEMELDNAILSIVPTNPLDGKLDHDFTGLSDSSSSGSSLLGKLEETMVRLKMEQDLSSRESKLSNTPNDTTGSVVLGNAKNGVEGERETIKVDLRLSHQVNRKLRNSYNVKLYVKYIFPIFAENSTGLGHRAAGAPNIDPGGDNWLCTTDRPRPCIKSVQLLDCQERSFFTLLIKTYFGLGANQSLCV